MKTKLICANLPLKFKTMTRPGKRSTTIVRWINHAMLYDLLANPVTDDCVPFGLHLNESLLFYVDMIRDRHNITRSECLTRLAIAGYRAEHAAEALI